MDLVPAGVAHDLGNAHSDAAGFGRDEHAAAVGRRHPAGEVGAPDLEIRNLMPGHGREAGDEMAPELALTGHGMRVDADDGHDGAELRRRREPHEEQGPAFAAASVVEHPRRRRPFRHRQGQSLAAAVHRHLRGRPTVVTSEGFAAGLRAEAGRVRARPPVVLCFVVASRGGAAEGGVGAGDTERLQDLL